MATEYNGINYFPLQTGFFEGNIQELLEAKYGIKGPYLVMQLLCKLYKEGYYLQWGEDQTMIFAHKLGREYAQEEVKEIIEILIEKGFFDKKSYEKHQILTSEGIQRVWIEATNRRKRDLTRLPYLLIDITDNKEANGGTDTKTKKCKQKEVANEQDVDIFATQVHLNEENADIFRQSKEKKMIAEKIKELPPSIPPQGTKMTNEEDSLLPPPPEYALNPKTHNYKGLLENLQRLNVTDVGEIKSIIRLSNYGEKGKPFWKLIAQTDWKKITAPGRYMIKALLSG